MKRGPPNSLVHVVIAQDVAHVLAQEALDALAELLDAIDFFLAHPPGAVRLLGLRLERRDPLVDLVVPGDVRHQVLDDRKRLASGE